MSSILTTFFASAFTPTNRNYIPVAPANQIGNIESLGRIRITESLKKLKINTTPAMYMFSYWVIKEAKYELVELLTIFFNYSFQSGTIPDEWKLATRTPIKIKGKSIPSNYRSISWSSTIGKHVNHLEEKNLLRETQHGFRSKRSLLTNVLDFLHDIFI